MKGDVLYATAMGWPQDGKLVIKSLSANSRHFPNEIKKVEWLQTKQSLVFDRTEKGLVVTLPEKTPDELNFANVVSILS
jgi:alpha-L-fucosidase